MNYKGNEDYRQDNLTPNRYRNKEEKRNYRDNFPANNENRPYRDQSFRDQSQPMQQSGFDSPSTSRPAKRQDTLPAQNRRSY